MENDPNYEDQSEIDEEDSSGDDKDQAVVPHSFDESFKFVEKPRHPSHDNTTEEYSVETREERCERLQSHYNDQYLNLLNESTVDKIEAEGDSLDSTQIGVTSWSRVEKERFYAALSKKSKADVRGIATSIGSKCELEVHEYLRLLEEEDRNRNLYAEEVDNVSQADIPAAAEITIECEALLEQAADALAVYQDKFDRATGEKLHDCWIIGHAQAEAYDKMADNVEEGRPPQYSPVNGPPVPARGLFRLSSWLSLTERVFMNSDPSRSQNNWTIHAAQHEVPAITQEAVSTFYETLVYQLRKVIQTSIFCAESRIRSTRVRTSHVRPLVRKHDVATAIGILGLENDAFQFWPSLARRNQLKVVDDHHKKGGSRSALLNYDEVEAILSEEPRRGRRSTLSSSVSSSVTEDSYDVGELDDAGSIDGTDALPFSEAAEQPACKEKEQLSYPALLGNDRIRVSDDDETSSATSDEEELSSFGEVQDRLLEKLDQANSQLQESQLCHDLAWATSADLRQLHFQAFQAREELQQMTDRKSRSDLIDWRDSTSSHNEPWEEHGQGPEEAGFVQNQRSTKRRKIEQDSGNQRGIPFRALHS